jgi:hypothetical protein
MEEWWRKADILGASEHSSARGLALVLFAIPNGGTANGKQISSQKTIENFNKKR